MSLMSLKSLERHKLMFKEIRNRESVRYGSQHSLRQLSGLTTQTQSRQAMERTVGQTLESTQRRNDFRFLFQEVIEFGNYFFVYDKHFLKNLKQLSKELKILFTIDKNKSRNMCQNIKEFNEKIEKQKNQLILKIKDKMNEITAEDDKHETREVNRKPNGDSTQRLRKTIDIIETKSVSESDIEGDDGYSSIENITSRQYSEEHPLFVQQWLDSQREEDFRFSDHNFMIKSHSQCLPSGDSGLDTGLDSGLGSGLGSGLNSYMDSQTESQMKYQLDSQSATPSVDSQAVMASKMSGRMSSQIKRLNNSLLQIVNRHKWLNTDFDIKTGITLKSDPQNKVRTQAKRRRQLKFVLERILGLIENDTFCTKRDLYYQNVLLFCKSQRVVDEIIDDLASSLGTFRIRLHIVSSTRGLVFGHLSFRNTNGVETDCLSSPNGINIPNDTERLTKFESNAKFVLIVEKDATFQQLIDLGIHRKFPLIMVTGHGYPDWNTRAFIQILWNTFEIPIFGLVDGDGHGLEILCTFKYGSLALAYAAEDLNTPSVKWLGILPTDISEYRLSPTVQIDLKETDKKKIMDVKERVYIKSNPEWSRQLDILLKVGKKVEIQSLAEHWPTFLLDVYLPAKIRYGKWI